jgi:hypothetical protein
MRRTTIAILMAMALVLAFGSQAVFAQAAGGGAGQTPTMPPRGSEKPTGGGLLGERPMTGETPPMAVPRAGEIIGLTVTNDQHQELGTVDDLILSSDGRISYVVISSGGVLGVGEKLCAIPWQTSNPRIRERALVVNVSKERFERAPTFGNWAEFKEGGYESKVRSYYGEGAGFEGQKEKPMWKEQHMGKPPQEPSTN